MIGAHAWLSEPLRILRVTEGELKLSSSGTMVPGSSSSRHIICSVSFLAGASWCVPTSYTVQRHAAADPPGNEGVMSLAKLCHSHKCCRDRDAYIGRHRWVCDTCHARTWESSENQGSLRAAGHRMRRQRLLSESRYTCTGLEAPCRHKPMQSRSANRCKPAARTRPQGQPLRCTHNSHPIPAGTRNVQRLESGSQAVKTHCSA